MSKYICGTYKGYRIVQDGEMIGNNWYGTFYAYQKINVRYKKVKGLSSKTLKGIKEQVDIHLLLK